MQEPPNLYLQNPQQQWHQLPMPPQQRMMTLRQWLEMRLNLGMNDKLLIKGRTFRIRARSALRKNIPFLDLPIVRMKTSTLPFPYNGQFSTRHNLLIWFGSHGFTPQVRVYPNGLLTHKHNSF
jgi:hypothetical protein